MDKVYFKSMRNGLLATSILLAVYFLILTLVSDWSFAWQQFQEYWPFIVTLAFGFGIQISAYSYLIQREIPVRKRGGESLFRNLLCV